MFDAFSPFPLRFSASPTPQERQYDALKAQLGPGFESPVQESIVYGVAMALGAAQLQQEGAAAQADPLQCTVLLDELEKDYQIVPQLGQSVSSRQLTLASAMSLEAGAIESAIETGLTAILGSDFIGWRSLNPDTEVEIHCGDNRQANWIIESPVDVVTATLATGTCAVCYGQYLNRWVAVSNATSTISYCAFTSDNDGLTWFPAGGATVTLGWNSVTTDGQTYVAVGNSNFMASPNGETWTDSGLTSCDYKKVAHGGGKFVAVGDSCVTYSADGYTWYDGTVTAHPWKALAFGNGIWIALSTDGYVCTSSDGITFSAAAALAGQWQAATFGNGVFVAIRLTGTYRAMWSRDGVTWNNSSIPTRDYYDITFADGLFVAVDPDTPSYTLASSTDGATWTDTLWTRPGVNFLGLASKPNKVVGVVQGNAFALHVYPYPTLVPDTTPIKHVRFLEDVMPGTATVTCEVIVNDGNELFAGEILTVEPGRIGQQEQVTVISATPESIPMGIAGTFTAVFTRPHEYGSRATTAPWPNWQSTKQHSLVLVKSSVLTNPTKLAQINTFMRKIMPATHTWLTTTGNGAYVTQLVVGLAVGQYPIGGFLEADPT